MVGHRRPIVVVAGEVCTQVGSVVADSTVADQVVADSVAAVVAADVDRKRAARAMKHEYGGMRMSYVIRKQENLVGRLWAFFALFVLIATLTSCSKPEKST